MQELQKENFSKHLFWDVNVAELDLSQNKTWFVGRVLEQGLIEDWIQLNRTLGFPEITERAKELRSLDDVSLNFIATLSGEPKSAFRCYTTKQLQPKHWDF
ncbi:MAG: DUF6922 domain-containing protein [Bacteroidia bacterium]